MPFYLCEYVGDGTRAVPFRPALFDEAAGCSAIDIRPDASRLDGGGINAALVWCPLDLTGPKWIKLGLEKIENLSAARIQAIYTKLKIAARNAGTRIDDILADLLITPPAKGWNGLLPNRGFYEIWLGPKTDKLLFKMATIGGGATDNFNRANETPLASPWGVSHGGAGGNCNLSSNAVTADSTTDKFIYYSGSVTSANQYAQWLYASAITNDDWGPAVRIDNTAGDRHGYWYSVYAGGFDGLNKFVSNAFTHVEDWHQAFGVGDTARIEASGSTISGYRNGVEVSGSPATDTSLTSAGLGAGAFVYQTGGSIDDFDGGDLGGGGGSPTLAQIEHATGRGSFRGIGRGVR